MARRRSKGRRRSKVRGRSKGRGSRARPATKKHSQRSKHTRVIIETDNRGSKRTTVYEEIYEEEW